MTIQAHDATISTATVEIRTLVVSGKQMTLAVFRQLPEEFPMDGDGYLLGELWGRVNYCPDRECRDLWEHVHVVWQNGSELRRATVRCLLPPVPSAAVDWWGGAECYAADCRLWNLWLRCAELPQLFIAV